MRAALFLIKGLLEASVEGTNEAEDILNSASQPHRTSHDERTRPYLFQRRDRGDARLFSVGPALLVPIPEVCVPPLKNWMGWIVAKCEGASQEPAMRPKPLPVITGGGPPEWRLPRENKFTQHVTSGYAAHIRKEETGGDVILLRIDFKKLRFMVGNVRSCFNCVLLDRRLKSVLSLSALRGRSLHSLHHHFHKY